MGDRPVVVVDTNVLANLATLVVDGRDRAPTGADPLKAVLTVYDVHVPNVIVGELTEIITGDNVLATAADTVLSASQWLTTHDLQGKNEEVIDYPLDDGEAHCIALAYAIAADMFVTDEFNSANFQLISLAIDDRNSLFTTPHLLCNLANFGVLEPRYVDHALTYFIETKRWDRSYVDALRSRHLASD